MTTGYLLLGSVAIRETFRLQNCDGSSSEFHVMFHLLHFSMGIRHHSIHQTTHINLMPVNTSTRAFPEFRTLDCKLIRPIFSLSHVQYWAYYWCTTDKFEVPSDSHLSEKKCIHVQKEILSLPCCLQLSQIYIFSWWWAIQCNGCDVFFQLDGMTTNVIKFHQSADGRQNLFLHNISSTSVGDNAIFIYVEEAEDKFPILWALWKAEHS